MKNEIDDILNKKQFGSIINLETTFKVVVGDDITEYNKPGFDIMTTDYFFEVWVNDTYSYFRKINMEYKDEALGVFKAGWDDCGNDLYNNLIVFNGDLNYCKEQFEIQADKNLDEFGLIKNKGFILSTMNYKDDWLGKIFQGYKARFIYNTLVYRIAEREKHLINKVNYNTVTAIEELWIQLINHPKLKITKNP